MRTAGFAVLASLFACTLGFVVPAASASAASGSDPAPTHSTLQVVVTGPRIAGKALTITAAGTNAPDKEMFAGVYQLDVLLVDPALLAGPCNPSYSAEQSEAIAHPKAFVDITLTSAPNEGTSGPFRIREQYTPGGSGPLRVCAYSIDLLEVVSAHASTEVGIAPGPKVALPASADPAYPNSRLHVVVEGRRVAGRPISIVATGTNLQSSEEPPFSYGLDLFVVDPALIPGPCKVSYNAEETLSINNADAVRLLTYDLLNEGYTGPFRIQTYFTPPGPGPLLVCAYSLYGYLDDAAHSSTEVTVVPAA